MKHYPLIMLCCFLFMYAWIAIPAGKMIKPFLLDRNYSISSQFYWFYISLYSVMFVLTAIIARHHGTDSTWLISGLFMGLVIDYALHYLQPYGYLSLSGFFRYRPEKGLFIPISYPMLMGIILTINWYIRWKQ